MLKPEMKRKLIGCTVVGAVGGGALTLAAIELWPSSSDDTPAVVARVAETQGVEVLNAKDCPNGGLTIRGKEMLMHFSKYVTGTEVTDTNPGGYNNYVVQVEKLYSFPKGVVVACGEPTNASTYTNNGHTESLGVSGKVMGPVSAETLVPTQSNS